MTSIPESVAKAFGAAKVELSFIRDGQGGASVWAANLDGKRFALRLSGPFLSLQPDWVEFEGRLLERAKERGVSVAAAVRGVDERYSQDVSGAIALLTEWAEGDVEWPTPAQKAFVLGKAVAELHLATSGLESPETTRRFDAEWLIDRPLSLLQEVANSRELLPHLESTRKRLSQLPVTGENFGPIHGDVHQGNCHFEGTQATLFDFAQCGIGWRVFDLAGFLWPWRDDSIQRPELRVACDAYLEGYVSVRALTPAELALLPAMVQLRDLWEAGEWIATGDGREKPDQVQTAIDSLAARWAANPIAETLDHGQAGRLS